MSPSSLGLDICVCQWHLLTFESGLCFYGNGGVESRMDETGGRMEELGLPVSCRNHSFLPVRHLSL